MEALFGWYLGGILVMFGWCLGGVWVVFGFGSFGSSLGFLVLWFWFLVWSYNYCMLLASVNHECRKCMNKPGY